MWRTKDTSAARLFPALGRCVETASWHFPRGAQSVSQSPTPGTGPLSVMGTSLTVCSVEVCSELITFKPGHSQFQLVENQRNQSRLLPSDVRLIVQHDAQQRTVDFHGAVVLDEAQFPKLVHELADTRPRGSDHLRERLLTDLRNDWLGSNVRCPHKVEPTLASSGPQGPVIAAAASIRPPTPRRSNAPQIVVVCPAAPSTSTC